MNELVVLQNDTPVTTSLKVAEVFGKRHDSVVRDIRKLTEQIEGLHKFVDTPMFTESTYIHEQNGQKYPMYYMNFDGFTLLTMGFSGKKALKFKLDYIKAFNAMRDKLTKILIERRNDEWREVRKSTKLNYRKQTDAIQQALIPLAREQGCNTDASKFYMNYARLLNKTLKIDANNRDNLTLGQLYELDKMQEMAALSIKDSAARGDAYKQIYANTKQLLENYAQISMFNQRFINQG